MILLDDCHRLIELNIEMHDEAIKDLSLEGITSYPGIYVYKAFMQLASSFF